MLRVIKNTLDPRPAEPYHKLLRFVHHPQQSRLDAVLAPTRSQSSGSPSNGRRTAAARWRSSMVGTHLPLGGVAVGYAQAIRGHA
jgi:hypothetical protein